MRALAVIVTLVLVCHPSATAQLSIDVFNADASQYPSMRASMIARDSAGAVAPVNGRVRIVDGQYTMTATVDTSSEAEPARLSIVIVVNVGVDIDWARSIVDELLRRVELPGDEVALVQVRATPWLRLPFGASRFEIFKAMATLQPTFAGDLGPTLIDTATGVLSMLSGRQGRAMILHIGDRRANYVPKLDTSELWRRLAADDIAIHSLIVGGEGVGIFGRMAVRSGGTLSESIDSTTEVVEAVARFMRDARVRPMIVRWIDEPSCELVRTPELIVDGVDEPVGFDFEAPASSVPILGVATPTILIPSHSVLPVDTTVTLRGVQSSTRIDSITVDDRHFEILDAAPRLPVVLQSGDSFSFRVRATAPDSLYAVARVTISSRSCRSPVLVLSSRGAMPAPRPIRVEITEPRDGRHFLGGDPVELRWKSYARTDSVAIDLSLDGNRWDTLSRGRTGYSHWWTAPTRYHDTVLMRVREITGTLGGPLAQIGGQLGYYERVVFSPDGRYMAAVHSGVSVFDVTGRELRRAYGDPYADVDFDPTSTEFLFSRVEGVAEIRSIERGTVRWSFETRPGLRRARFDPSGRRILMLVSGDVTDTALYVIDVPTSRVVAGVTGFSDVQTFAAWAPDGTRVVTGGHDGRVRVWDARDGRPLLTVEAGIGGALHDLRFSPDGSEILTCAGNVARRWDAGTGREIDSIDHGALVGAAVYSLDMTRIVTVGKGTVSGNAFRDRARVWDRASGELALTLTSYGAMITDVDIDRTGTRLYSGNANGVAHIWDIDTRARVSATVAIAIDAPDVDVTLSLVDFGVVRLGDTAVASYADVVCNSGNMPGVVREWTLAGSGVDGLVVSTPPRGAWLVERACDDLELRYAPEAEQGLSGEARLELADGTTADRVPVRATVVRGFVQTTAYFDLGSIEIGTTRETTLANALRNIGGDSIRVDSIVIGGDLESFELIEPKAPFAMAPGGLVHPRLRFTPLDTGSRRMTLTLLGTGDRTAPRLEVTARGVLRPRILRGEAYATVAPNPATSSAVVALDIPQSQVRSVELFDAAGRLYRPDYELEQTGTVTAIRMSLAGFAAGAYRIRVLDDSSVIATASIVIE